MNTCLDIQEWGECVVWRLSWLPFWVRDVRGHTGVRHRNVQQASKLSQCVSILFAARQLFRSAVTTEFGFSETVQTRALDAAIALTSTTLTRAALDTIDLTIPTRTNAALT
jgi:hypothetical protein